MNETLAALLVTHAQSKITAVQIALPPECTEEDLLARFPAIRDIPRTKVLDGVALTWREALPFLSATRAGMWTDAPGPSLTAWTKNLVVSVVYSTTQNGSDSYGFRVSSVPRHPRLK